MTSMIEVAYTTQQNCTGDDSIRSIANVRNMTIGIGCGCTSRRRRFLQVESLFSDEDYVLN